MKKIVFALFIGLLFFSCNPEYTIDKTEIITISDSEIGLIFLEWNQIFNAIGDVSYSVLRSTEEEGQYSEVATLTNNTQWVDNSEDLNSGVEMWYKVKTVLLDTRKKALAENISSAKKGSSIKFNTEMPAVAFTNIVAYSKEKQVITPASDPLTTQFKSIELEWSALEEADYYKIQQSDKDGNLLFMTAQNDVSLPFVISGSGEKVKTEIFNINGDFVNIFTIVPFVSGEKGRGDVAGTPSEKTEVSVSGNFDTPTWKTTAENAFKLEWTPVAGVTQYMIERKVDGITTELKSNVPYYVDDNDGAGLNPAFDYTYSFSLSAGLTIKLGKSQRLRASVYFPGVAIVKPTFFSKNELTITQGEENISLSWGNAKELDITEYKIYREKIVDTWENNAGTAYFSINSAYTLEADLSSNKVDSIASDSYEDVNKLLYIGTISALNGAGEKEETVTWIDTTTGNDKTKPGKYRYYVVGKKQIISAIGYRAINDQEFIQFTNRYLDLAIQNCPNNGDTLTSVMGGTFEFREEQSGNDYIYTFSNFNINGIIFNSQNFLDDAFKYNALPIFYYTRRTGSITVSGLYNGTLEFFLSRHWFSDKFENTDWDHSPNVKDLDISLDDTNKTQGWYVVKRGGSSTPFHWLDGYALGDIQNETDFNNASEVVKYKVEPDYTSDYIKWE